MRSRMDMVRPILIIPLLVLLVAGCGGGGSGTVAPGTERPDAVSLSESGLEARVWRVDAVGGPLLSALAPHALVAEVRPDHDRERWGEAGLRLVLIPAALAESLESGLPHSGAVRRLSLGQPTRWSGLAGMNVREGVVLGVPGGERGLGRGRLELLTRAWAEPTARAGRSFRVELVVAWSPLTGGSVPREILDGLLYSVSIPEGFALVVFPARPGEGWTSAVPGVVPGAVPGVVPGVVPGAVRPDDLVDPGVGPVPSDREHEQAGGVAPLLPPGTSPDSAGGAGAPGPEPTVADSVGEFLFISPAIFGDRPVPARRDVFVLIPRWP